MRSQPCNAVSRYLSGIPRLHFRIFPKEVHVPPVAPSINCSEVVVTGVWIGNRETALTQPRQHVVEFTEGQPDPAGCLLGRNIARVNMKPHHNRIPAYVSSAVGSAPCSAHARGEIAPASYLAGRGQTRAGGGNFLRPDSVIK